MAELACERLWLEGRRPYYSVFPVAVESLCKLKLDIDCSLVSLPKNQLFVRFPIGQELGVENQKKKVCSILVGESVNMFTKAKSTTEYDNSKFINGITLFVECGEHTDIPEARGTWVPYRNLFGIQLPAGRTVEEAIQPAMLEYKIFHPDMCDLLEKCIRLVCTLCLLGDDPEIIKPDVLNEDARRYDETGDQKYVERAHKRGKIGWVVGADWETCPHYRRPHLRLQMTGKGRTVPKIVNVKGTTVHRTKLSDVPTGYLDDDEAKTAERAEK